MNDHKSLWLIWQNAETRLYYHVGTLSYYENQYTFYYTFSSEGPQKVKDALNNGYMLHPSFPELTKVYKADKLFTVFNRRLPSEIRVDFKDILENLSLKEDFTPMDLLEQTRGKLTSDQYSFEKPLRLENNKLVTSFFVNGMSYIDDLPENWAEIIRSFNKLELKLEPENHVDKNAVAVYTALNIKLGYVPRFYTTGISALIENGANPLIKVNYINEQSNSDWWIKLDFECEIPSLDKEKLKKLDLIFENVI